MQTAVHDQAFEWEVTGRIPSDAQMWEGKGRELTGPCRECGKQTGCLVTFDKKAEFLCQACGRQIREEVQP